jgi:heterodisulfide reductase subunit A
MIEPRRTTGNGADRPAPRIGVYVCHCGLNIANRVDVPAVVEYAKGLPNVAVVREYKFMCADPGQDLIVQDLKAGAIDRVVVASCSPLMHELTFRRATATGGANPFLFQMANIREHVSWVTSDMADATGKAKDLVAGAVRRVAHHVPLERRKVPVHPDVLVVGGGIAGIHAALTLADAGKKVHLVERQPTIGGHMAQFDKTFPTLDCAACILTPKMNQVRSHPNIHLMTYSEVERVEGFVGNFKATVQRKARYVREDLCTGCDACTHTCPVVIPAEFELGLATRRAVHRPFPQAVPNVFTITRLGTPPCVTACPIHQNAHGYVTLAADTKWKKAVELVLRENPLPSVCARVCSRPCETSCVRARVDEAVAIRDIKRTILDRAKKIELKAPETARPGSVAVIGAGPAGLTCAHDLRQLGYATVVYEAETVAGGSLATTIPEFRLPRATLAAEIERLAGTGIEFRLGLPVGPGLTLEDIRSRHDAVFVAIGAPVEIPARIPGEDLPRVRRGADLLRSISRGETPALGARVLVLGGGDTALDAARCAARCGAGEVVWLPDAGGAEPGADPLEVREAEAEGIRIRRGPVPLAITQEGRRLRLSWRAAGNGGTETLDGDDILVSTGRRPDLDGLDPTGALRPGAGGLIEADPLTLETGRPGVFAGGECVSGPRNVVYAMAAGRKAAVSIHRFLDRQDLRAGRELEEPYESLLEVDTKGRAPKARVSIPVLPAEERRGFAEVRSSLAKPAAEEEAKRCLDCAICCDCRLCASYCERDAIDFTMKDEVLEIPVGAIIVATGFQAFDARRLGRYGYGVYPEVYTALEIERMVNASGPTEGQVRMRDGRPPRAVGIIHCVGSRDETTNRWCSRVCCMYSLKLAHLIKERAGAEIYNFYIDMRTAGKGYEEFYDKLLKEGVHFIRGRVAEVNDWATSECEKGRLVIRAEDTLIGVVRRIPVDMVVLATGLEPRPDAESVRRTFNLSCSREGWFLERHPKLAPVSTFTDGVFLAGACQGPKDIPDAVAQAGAASAEAMGLVDRGFVELEPNTAYLEDELCSGCMSCIAMCPYGALRYDPVRAKAALNEALCKGCGTCVAACPSGALQQYLYTDEQIYQEIEGILSHA